MRTSYCKTLESIPDAGYERDKLLAQLCDEHDDLSGATLYTVSRIDEDGYQVANTDTIRLLWWPDELVGAVIDNAQCYWASRDTPDDVLSAYLHGEDYDGDGIAR